MLSAWKFYRDISLTTTETDYVVTLSLTATQLDFAKCQPDGSDVVFVQNGVRLARYIEAFDPAAETATIQVRVPDCAQRVRMHYGGPSVPCSPTAIGREKSLDFRNNSAGDSFGADQILWSSAQQTATPDADDVLEVAVGPAPRPIRRSTAANADLVRTHTGGHSRTACRVPHQRSNFFMAGLWWRMYAEIDATKPHDLILQYSDDDGATWTTTETITAGTPGNDAQWHLAVDHARHRVSLVRNIQSNVDPDIFHDGLYMREFEPSFDGSITWLAATQTALATGNFAGDFSAEYDSEGHLWICYGDNGSGDSHRGSVMVQRNANTDGTWSDTFSPLEVQQGASNDAFGTVAPIGDRCHVLIYEWNTDVQAQGYVVDAAGGIKSEGAITELAVQTTVGSGATVGRIESISRNGEVWLAYQSVDQTVRVRRRTTAGNWEAERELAGSSYVFTDTTSPRLTVTPTGLVCCWSGRERSQVISALSDVPFWMATYDASDDAWDAPVPIWDDQPEETYEHLMPAHTAAPDGRFLLAYLDVNDAEYTLLVDPRPIAAERPPVARLIKTDATGQIGYAGRMGFAAGEAVEWDVYVVSVSTGGDTDDFLGFGSIDEAQSNTGFNVYFYGDGPDAGGSGPSIGAFQASHEKLAAISLNTWHRIKVVIGAGGTTYDLYLDGVLIGDGLTCDNNHDRFRCFAFSPHTGDLYWTNLRIRRHVATEPAATVSNERRNRSGVASQSFYRSAYALAVR